MSMTTVPVSSEDKKFINTISKPPARKCSSCGHGYYRVNTVEVWDARTPGKRLGWHKTRAKICTRCQDQKESKRILGYVSIEHNKMVVVRRLNGKK
jgi:hypothetical protein